MPFPIVPAAVLREIRDRRDVTLVALYRTFDIGWGGSAPDDARARNRLHACLRALAGVGLVDCVRRGPASSQGGVLPFFGEPPDETWSTTPALRRLQDALELSLVDLEASHRRYHVDEVGRLGKVREQLDAKLAARTYRTDLLASVEELARCLESRAYIAVMALSGKILEICLKQRMVDLGLPFDDAWMLGTLLGKLKDVPSVYLDPSLDNVANIIKSSRIPAVHAKRDVPIPSEDQAVMVARAVLDVIARTLLRGDVEQPTPP